jgi:hypothetical protein
MRIMCKVCNKPSAVVQVSPDYEPALHDAFVRDAVIVGWTYDGEPVDRYWFSLGWAASRGIFSSSSSELPDVYPDWVHEVSVECLKCFAERGGDSAVGRFD